MGERPVTVESTPVSTVTGGYRPDRRDVAALFAYVALAVVVLLPVWRDPAGVVLSASGSDTALNEWNLAYAAHVLTHGGNPFFTTDLNPPDGVNLMANTSVFGLGVPFAPLTLAAGPEWTLVTLLTLGVAGTAAAWYWLITRRILPKGDAPPTGHLAAALAGGLIGFSPTMVGHAGGTHVQMVSQFLLPFILWRALTLWQRPLRNGIVLGLLVTYQLFVGGEVLLIAALAGAVFIAVRAVQPPLVNWIVLKRFAAGVGVATGVVLVLAGYPLWTQFFGPQSYSGMKGMHVFGAKLPAWISYSSHSLAGPDEYRPWLTLNAAEQNGFFGWSLVVVAVCAAVWLWRWSAVSRALTLTAAVFGVLAAGSDIAWRVREPGIPGPWGWLGRLPVLESVFPARFAFVVTVCVALILALALHEAAAQASTVDRLPRQVMLVAVAAALLPILPTQLPVQERLPVPGFVTAAHWERYVRPGHTLVVAPRPDAGNADPMRWQYVAGFGFRIDSGYFVGPNENGDGSYYPPERRSETIALAAYHTGRVQPVTADDRAAARADLAAWRADAVVVDPRLPNAAAVRETVTDLYGVAEQNIGGLWLWDVRGAVEAPPS
jgi:hypothetical protein